jgi:hypothetical protein
MQGKTRPTCHVRFPRQSTYARRTLPTGGLHTRQPFTSHQQSWASPLLLRKRAPDTIHSASLTDPRVHTQHLSHNSQWSSGEKLSFCWQSTTRLTGSMSLACDRYVQFLLAGTNRTVLNRHKWGLQPCRCWLSMYHSPTFLTSCLPFPPKGPTRSPV